MVQIFGERIIKHCTNLELHIAVHAAVLVGEMSQAHTPRAWLRSRYNTSPAGHGHRPS